MDSTTTLGKYRLLAELGRGGMAKVYLAVAHGPAGFNKLVVVKQIQAQFAEDPDFVTMFLDEARLAARLNHPNVVQTNEVGQDGDRYFIAMEYLEGQTLNRILNKLTPQMSMAMQLRIVSEALAGLHHAHELKDYDGSPLGVVHRDVSPHNIFVTYSGQVKVVDFGIAKAFNSKTETRTGVLKGKVAYMAPEQASGDRVDRRADVFAMGIVLWQIVAGKRMFRGLPEIVVVKKLLDGELTPILEEAPNTDPRLAAIVTRSLEINRDNRYASAAEFQAAIDEYLDTLDDRRGCREVGKLAAATFAEDRVRVEQIIEHELKGEAARPIDQLPLLETGTFSESGRSLAGSGPRRDPLGLTGSTPSFVSPQSVTHPSAAPSTKDPSTITSVTMRHTPTSATRVVKGGANKLVIAGGVAAILAGGVVAVLALRSPSEPAAQPSATAAAAKAFTLRIESSPAGATVREGDRVLGATPLELPVSASAAREFTLLLDGYEPHKLAAGPVERDITLVAPLRSAASSAPPPSSSTAEPIADTEEDPKKPGVKKSGPRKPTPGATKPTATAADPGLDIKMTR